MTTNIRLPKGVLTVALALFMVLTAVLGLLNIRSKATPSVALEQKTSGWYAMRDNAVDLHFNGVLQNPHGTWFVEDGHVNFGYTGWLVCEGTYYYVKFGRAETPAALPAFAIARSRTAATTAKTGKNDGTSKPTDGTTYKTAKIVSKSSVPAPVVGVPESATAGGASPKTTKAAKTTKASKATNATQKANASTNNTAKSSSVTTTTRTTSTTAGTTTSTSKQTTKRTTPSQSQNKTNALEEDELPIIAD